MTFSASHAAWHAMFTFTILPCDSILETIYGCAVLTSTVNRYIMDERQAHLHYDKWGKSCIGANAFWQDL